MRTENQITSRIATLLTEYQSLPGTPDYMEQRAHIFAEIQRWLDYKNKIDGDYGHWDDIIDNGYDKDDPDDYNYPPPSPPPPDLSALLS